MEKIKLLYTDIGRGHPFYLDGIVEELNRNGGIESVHSKSTVFEHSTGSSLKAWQLVRSLYKHGGKDSAISKIYKRLRKNNDYNKASMALNLLGRDLKKSFLFDMSPLVVAHPILISILNGRKNLYYQHGELITPNEAVVSGAESIFVPTESAAEPFLTKYSKEQVIITGLCIESSIARMAQDVYDARIQRYESTKPLTGCFISSGAEPLAHVKIIINSLLSHVHSNGKAILFVKKDGLLEKSVENILGSIDTAFLKVNSLESLPYELPQLTIVQFANRRDENRLTSHFFSDFDFIVSPSHERSNWAVGLGLPMFITDPPIGPFAPLNRKLLIDSHVAVAIENISDANAFAFRLKKMHIENSLKQMSENGWGKQPINGFQEIVSYIKNNS